MGCGDNSPIRFLHVKKYGIDASTEAIMTAKKKKTHDNLKVMDVKQVVHYFKSKSIDAVIALDLIEHLNKKDGFKLLSDMESLAIKKVVIFTPNGFIPQAGKSKYDKHLSGWEVEDFKRLNYKVNGIYGPRFLRGSYHKIKHTPEFFWSVISDLIQWSFTINHPENAAALLGVKKINYD